MRWVNILLFCSLLLAYKMTGQDTMNEQKQLEFLLGTWSVERSYFPKTPKEVLLKGVMKCKYDLEGKFIRCVYQIPRPEKSAIYDVVYYNYNAIHSTYDNLWLSATWPIKVLMQGKMSIDHTELMYTSEASFKIQEGATEYVRSTLKREQGSDTFVRDTYISTSSDTIWRFHLREKVRKQDVLKKIGN